MKKGIIKVVAFVLIFILLFQSISALFQDKWLDRPWEYSSISDGFYALDKNSIDVLFLGTSHVLAGIDPMELYEETGIASYNLGANRQPIMASYYWMLEAEKTQQLRYVLLDTSSLFNDWPEVYYRQAFDSMNLSMNKVQGIYEHTRDTEDVEFLSYLFPIVNYHSRWSALDEEDFTNFFPARLSATLGYAPIFSQPEKDKKDFSFVAGESSEQEDMIDISVTYLKKIAENCAEKNIKLVLYKTTTQKWDIGKYNSTMALADELGVPYLDFNEATLMDAVDFDYQNDCMGEWPAHLNYNGAKKLTDYLGYWMLDDSDSTLVRDSSETKWLEDLKPAYQDALLKAKLEAVSDFGSYMNVLSQQSDGSYSVLLAGQNIDTAHPDETCVQQLTQLGLSPKKMSEATHYIAVLENGTVTLEKSGDEQKTKTISLADKSSWMLTGGTSASIVHRGVEYAMQKDGINLVVYNTATGNVVQSNYFSVKSGTMLGKEF